MKNSSLRLRNLVMYCDVALVRHQHLRIRIAPYTFSGLSCDVAKTSPPRCYRSSFRVRYDKSTLSYEKELRNKRVVAKVR